METIRKVNTFDTLNKKRERNAIDYQILFIHDRTKEARLSNEMNEIVNAQCHLYRKYRRKNASAKIYANDLHFNWKCSNKKKITKSFADLYKALQKFLMVQRDEADEKMSLKAFKTIACFMVQGWWPKNTVFSVKTSKTLMVSGQ